MNLRTTDRSLLRRGRIVGGVPTESVPIESVPIESVPIESVPIESVPARGGRANEHEVTEEPGVTDDG